MQPLGYKVEDGKIVVDEPGAEKIRRLFDAYLKGHSMRAVGEIAGIKKFHSSIAGMLNNRLYVGDEIYPAIIDEEIFQRVHEEKAKRRKHRRKKASGPKPGMVRFSLKKPKQKFEDPFKQAEYAYSLIKTEVIPSGP